jgi:hypothetical protein
MRLFGINHPGQPVLLVLIKIDAHDLKLMRYSGVELRS